MIFHLVKLHGRLLSVKSLQNDVIPVLEKQWKKTQRAQHRQQREQIRLNAFRSSKIARSCRNQRTVNYRFDDYDRAITEAIHYVNKRKSSKERKQEEKPSQHGKRTGTTSNGSNNSDSTSRDSESTESDAGRTSDQGRDEADNSSHEEYDGDSEDDGNNDVSSDQEKVVSQEQNMPFVQRSKGLRFSKSLAGIPGHTVPESMNVRAKNRLRQRPSVNSAVEFVVVPDSED